MIRNNPPVLDTIGPRIDMRTRYLLAALTVSALACSWLIPPASAAKKKKKDEEPVTQTLPVLKDPPLSVTADTDRLSFRVAPLSPKGLLSAQVRDALKYLLRENRGTIVKLRAFVAGTGDMRRVPTIVSETFTDRKLPLPALTTVQAGALPLEGAQVVIESTSVEKKAVTPHGVALLEAMTIEQVEAALGSLQLSGGRVLRATCYLPSLDDHAGVRAKVAAAFPAAAVNIVQLQRLPVRTSVTCETVAALERPSGAGVTMRDNGHVAVLPASRVILTGAQLAFRNAESDVRLAFERLGRTLEAAGTSYRNVVAANVYPLDAETAGRVRSIQPAFFSKDRPPVVSTVLMEGLPGLEASFAVEVIALPGSQ